MQKNLMFFQRLVFGFRLQKINLNGYYFLPTIVVLALITVYPIIYALNLALSDYNLAPGCLGNS